MSSFITKSEESNSAALLAEARKLRAKKRFSQNFLVNANILQRIVQTVNPQAGETVVEIGPGTGFLTRQLLEAMETLDPLGQLMAIELERQMLAYLKQQPLSAAPNFQLIESDVLKYDFSQVLVPQFKIVGNLPYNITSPILFYLSGELHEAEHPLRRRIKQATFMVQKEVGERICAKAGSSGYNALSIALQYWFHTKLNFLVPSHSFYPRPKVESAVISLIPRSEPLMQIHDLVTFSRLIKTAFHQRRKTLKNALAPFAEPALLDKMFTHVSRSFEEQDDKQSLQSKRAQELSIEMLGALANAYTEYTR